MDIRNLLIDARDNDRWKDLSDYGSYKLCSLALKHYFKTSEFIIPDNFYVNLEKKVPKIIKENNLECLPLEVLLIYNFYDDDKFYDFEPVNYYKIVIMQKIREKESLIQELDLWRKFAFSDIDSKNSKFEILDLILEKGYVSIFFSDLFDYNKYEKNQYKVFKYGKYEYNVPDVKNFNFDFYEYPKNNIDKIENAIRSGVRIKKVDFAPSELLYDDRILSALVDTGQIDAMVEDNRYDNINDYALKKPKIDKTLKLHKFVPEIIKNLEEVNYNYRDFDINRMKNFVLDEDYERINDAYLKYKEDIKNVRFIPQKEDEKEEVNSKDIVVNMLDEGVLTEDDLLEIIVGYRKKEKKVLERVKKFKIAN